MRIRSFRVRLLLGSVLWTLGLLYVAHMLSLVFIRHFEIGHVIHVEQGAGGGRDAAITAAREKFAGAQRHVYVRGGILSVVLMSLGLWIVAKGQRSLRELHRRVAAVRDGSEGRLTGSYPSEVQPVVNDLNALLEHRELLVERAQAKAGDLAHGLKTPLAVLAQEAARVATAGQPELAATITQQVERMRRQIDYHLAQARAAASGSAVGAHTSLRESAEGIARTLERLHDERGIDIVVEIDAAQTVRVERQDLDELLGNLLENACQWARSRVSVTSAQQAGLVIVAIDDDGPGIDASMREAVLRRGVRADQAAPGSGLGLAIVRDLAELYGGGIRLESSPEGGLRARLTLPG